MALNDIYKTFSFTVNSSMNKYKACSNIVRSITHCKKPSNICLYKQFFVTAAIFKTIRHKIYLKTPKNVRYSKQKSKSRSETLKILHRCHINKTTVCGIVMISVFDLAPALAILWVMIF